MTPPRIQFEHISKAYYGTQVLTNISFPVQAGCVHAIVGENGAGKSTLMKILAGAVRAEDGQISIDGQVVEIRSTRQAQSLGIAIVHQEFNLAPHLSVSENVYLGRWPQQRWTGLIRYEELHEQTERLFNSIGLSVPARRRVETLSIAQQQMVEIAKALSFSAKILILDEPTAVLMPQECVTLFRVVKEMTARGVSVLYVSHRLDEIFQLADFVTVLRDGQHISTRPIGEVKRDQLITETVGRPLEDEFPRRHATQGEVLLDMKSLSVTRRFHDVSFDIRAGEVLGLTGMVGSGRSSIAKGIFGAIGPIDGMIRMMNTAGPFTSPRAAKRAGIAFVPEDRKREGLLLARATRENITLAHREDVASHGYLSPAMERPIVETMTKRLNIRMTNPETYAVFLSGGNQQKVMLARWLLRPYRIVLLDEPTRGVDVGAKAEIYNIINHLAENGTGILMISSELPEVIGMADRIGVMARGRLAGILDNRNRNVTQEEILRIAVGEPE